jgi:hypothetical protein
MAGYLKSKVNLTEVGIVNNQLYHLIVFIAALGALLAIILTGHDGSGSLTTLVTQIAAGVLGGSGASALGNLVAPPTNTASAPTASKS